MEHSPPDGALPWIQDAPLLDEYYSATREEQVRADKYARLHAESLDVGRHIVAKSPSHLEFRNCMSGNPCALCAQALDRRRRDLPNFTMEALLAPLAFNDYRLPYPTYIEGRAPVSGPPPENASARAPTPAEDRDWVGRVNWVQPSSEERLSERKGGPYLSFKQVLGQGQPQPEVNIPMSTSGAERFIHCDFTPSCRYCAKSKRELDGHKCFHLHDVRLKLGGHLWTL